MNETWKPVQGWEGLYEVSDFGRVRSLDRPVNGKGSGRRGRVLKLRVIKGYNYAHLSRLGAAQKVRVCRMVLEAFRGPRSNMVARHGFRGSLDDTLPNLAWGTHQDNSDDMVTHGTRIAGEQHGGSRLTEAQVRYVRQNVKIRGDRVRIARELGTTPTNISQIVLRQSWKHVL